MSDVENSLISQTDEYKGPTILSAEYVALLKNPKSRIAEYRASQTVYAQEAAFLKEVVNRLGELEKLALKGKLREYHLDGFDDPNGVKTNIDLLSIKDAIDASGTSGNLSTALHSKREIIKGLWAIVKPEIAYQETLDRIRFCQQGIMDENGGLSEYQKVIFGDAEAPEGSSRRLSLSIVIDSLGGPKEFGITETELDEFEIAAMGDAFRRQKALPMWNNQDEGAEQTKPPKSIVGRGREPD